LDASLEYALDTLCNSVRASYGLILIFEEHELRQAAGYQWHAGQVGLKKLDLTCDDVVQLTPGQFPAPLLAISKKGFDAVVANNLTGGFLMMRELFNQCMQQHGGAIVNMTADFRNGMPGMGHSGAARAGMSNLTMTAAFEWAHAGVRVNAVAPGWIASSGMDTYGPAMQSIIKQLKGAVPLRRTGVEAEVSGVICFLLSPAAAFVTGITVQIDGGASLGSEIFPLGSESKSVPFDGFHRAVTPKVFEE
jgi:citronellol/citronellal dehydrogenase